MPQLSDFFGIIVRLNWKDVDQHNKPHVHAFYGEFEAAVSLDGELLAGEFPAKQLKQLRKWLAVFDVEVQEAWDKAVEGEQFLKIDGLGKK
ncbi:MAG: DUF4160 domain-containing protein [Candidatus Ancillula sp.]|jgi:hypothetical protein|nr:DUF4160 domain-containing protein [Candidatus Ancillula sp.]